MAVLTNVERMNFASLLFTANDVAQLAFAIEGLEHKIVMRVLSNELTRVENRQTAIEQEFDAYQRTSPDKYRKE